MSISNTKQEYTVKGEKFKLPKNWNEKILSGRSIVGNLESYPAHASGRQRACDEIVVNKKGRVEVIHESESQLKNLVPKPSFLSFLEEHIHKELIRLDCPPKGPDFKRLQVYREAFEWIIEAFRSYKPILQLFKEEYEKNFVYYDAEIKRLKPVETHLYTICGEYEKKLRGHTESENERRIKAKQKRDDLEQRVQIMKDEAYILDGMIKDLKADLSSKHEEYIAQVDARKLLNIDTNSLRSQLEDLTLIQQSCQLTEKSVRPENMIISVKRARAACEEVTTQLNQLEEKYSKSVPRRLYLTTKQEYIKLSSEVETLNKEISDYTKDINQLKETIVGLKYERDFFYLKMCEAQSQAKTENRIDFNRIIDLMLRLTSTPNITRKEIFLEIQKEMKKDTQDVLSSSIETDLPETKGVVASANPTYLQMAEFLEIMLGAKPHSIFKPSSFE